MNILILSRFSVIELVSNILVCRFFVFFLKEIPAVTTENKAAGQMAPLFCFCPHWREMLSAFKPSHEAAL